MTETNNKGKGNIVITYDDKGRKKYNFQNFNFDNTDNDNDNQLKENSKIVNEYIDQHPTTNDKREEKNFFCQVCNIDLKDSTTYIEHIHGRLHNSKLGNNLKVTRIDVERVKQKLKLLNSKRNSEIELIRQSYNKSLG